MKRAKKIPSGKKAGRARKRGVLILMSGVVVLLVSACGLSARLEEETVPWAELKASVPAAPDDPERKTTHGNSRIPLTPAFLRKIRKNRRNRGEQSRKNRRSRPHRRIRKTGHCCW